LFKRNPLKAAGEGSTSRFGFSRGSMWSSRKVDNKGKSPLVPAPGSSRGGSMHETGPTEPPVAGSPATGPAIPKRGSSLGKTLDRARTWYRTDEVEPGEPPKLPRTRRTLKKTPPASLAAKSSLEREQDDRAGVQRPSSLRNLASLGPNSPSVAPWTAPGSKAPPSGKRSLFRRFAGKGNK
jgi:hypothetical protein